MYHRPHKFHEKLVAGGGAVVVRSKAESFAAAAAVPAARVKWQLRHSKSGDSRGGANGRVDIIRQATCSSQL